MISRGRLYFGRPPRHPSSAFGYGHLSVLSPRRRVRDPRRWRFLIGICVSLLFVVTSFLGTASRKLWLDGITALRYRLYSELQTGRLQAGPECPLNGGDSPRRAIVTYLMTEEYLPLLEHLHCSVLKSNPGLEFLVMVTKSVSSTAAARIQQRRIQMIEVEDIQFPNSYEYRFRYNWLKIRAFELPYDAVLLVDSDVVILEDVSALFSIPTRFAAVDDQVNRFQESKYPRSVRILQGGVLFLRPCPAVSRHMQILLADHPRLQFSTSNAEQEFFSWYFRHEAMVLPRRYNALPSSLDELVKPAIVHYTSRKPFKTFWHPTGPEQYLCTESEVAAGREVR